MVTLEFNQKYSLERQLRDILKLKLRVSRRRVLDISTLVNEGVTYRYEILSDGRIQLYLDLDTDLQNPVFDVIFTDPTAIISTETGGTLQDTD